MTKLIATQGLPASGKTSWALEQITKRPGQTIRVNRDDIRASVHGGGKWSKGKEKITVAVRDAMISEGLEAGLTVISDDTNLSPRVVERLRALAKAHGAQFEIKDFTDITPETCIKRDLGRDRTVGAKVIMGMFNSFLKPDETVTVDESLPKCVIVDVDGTLALHVTRGPFQYEKCLEDAPNPRVVELIKTLKSTYQIVVCSGREGTEQCRDDTVEWLHRHGITYSDFFIRAEGDTRKDSVIKREILEEKILPKYAPVLVVDDRDQVVRMWRDAGLPCWQVADGDF